MSRLILKSLSLLALLSLFCLAACGGESSPSSSSGSSSQDITAPRQSGTTVVQQPVTPTPTPVPVAPQYLKGKSSSLSWITGGDCQSGIQAYLQTAHNNPDAALVGTAWVNPLDGSFIVGSNTCQAGTGSMDSVVQLIHSNGGMAYLTITMDTEGPGAWSFQQGAAYVVTATHNQAYIDTIVQEVQRAGYDGAIMDLEGVDVAYPGIQQSFALFNQKVWAALRPLHKWYGIALVHKISDHDTSYKYNGFENWSLLSHTADFLVIMALDQSREQPGPCVSLPWLKQMLTYAMVNMPDMLPHLIWELPLYGNTWHQDGSQWNFDDIVTYDAARSQIQQVASSQIDQQGSDLQDATNPHVAYTDQAGVKRAVWYMTPKGLYTLIVSFKQELEALPQFAGSRLQVAVWWRNTQEPVQFWTYLDTLY